MAEVTATNIVKHSAGSQTKVTATLTDISTSETFKVVHLRTISDWYFSPTSGAGDTLSASISGNVLTLTPTSSGSQDGIIAVFGQG